MHTEAGIRALQKDQPTNPTSVMDYLKRAFGDAFDDARNAMALLAGAHEPQELAAAGYRLYEEFRPEIPAGVRGWGAKGCLDLDQIRAMAREVR